MHDDDQPDWIEWLGLRKFGNFRKSRALGGLIGVIGTITAVVFLGLVIVETFQALLGIGLEVDTTQHEAIRNLGLALAAIIGLPFLVWRSIVAQKQVDVAEQGQITDRINDAVKGLGTEKTVKRQRRDANGEALYVLDADGTPDETQPIWDDITEPNLEVRIGAIYALERIAQDSDRDHIQIMEILCAYIRQNAPASEAQETLVQKWRREDEAFDAKDRAPFPDENEILVAAQKLKSPRADIHAALDVLKRRHTHQINLERQDPRPADKAGYRLDLRRTNLQGADLVSAQLAKARLDDAHLEGAWLNWAHLEGARLIGAHLEGARLNGAHLEVAVLSGAHLEGAELYRAHLEGAGLNGAHLEGAELYRAHLERAWLIGAHLEGARLDKAHLEGAHLEGARLDKASFDAETFLTDATLRGASVKNVDLSTLDLSQDQVNSLFGDDTTILPPDITPPDWHSRTYASGMEFFEAWRAYKAAHDIP